MSSFSVGEIAHSRISTVGAWLVAGRTAGHWKNPLAPA
jgi:hypothetical protein